MKLKFKCYCGGQPTWWKDGDVYEEISEPPYYRLTGEILYSVNCASCGVCVCGSSPKELSWRWKRNQGLAKEGLAKERESQKIAIPGPFAELGHSQYCEVLRVCGDKDHLGEDYMRLVHASNLIRMKRGDVRQAYIKWAPLPRYEGLLSRREIALSFPKKPYWYIKQFNGIGDYQSPRKTA